MMQNAVDQTKSNFSQKLSTHSYGFSTAEREKKVNQIQLVVSPKVVATRPNYSSLFRRVQQSALKSTLGNQVEKVKEKAKSKGSIARKSTNNIIEFETNKTTAAP